MYVVEADCVYYCHPHEEGTRELFLTVHPTKDSSKTPAEQAYIIARMLNSDASLRYCVFGT
jgi:hypothetical protein